MIRLFLIFERMLDNQPKSLPIGMSYDQKN